MLTKEALQKIIDQFDEAQLKRQGVFGIYQFGGGPDESFIKANKEGLELFALELLKSARDTEAILIDPEKNAIPFDHNEDWIDESSASFIHYVEPIAGTQKAKQETQHQPTIADKLMPLGYGLIAIILVISLIVGLVTICKWIF